MARDGDEDGNAGSDRGVGCAGRFLPPKLLAAADSSQPHYAVAANTPGRRQPGERKAGAGKASSSTLAG
ncbi:MAG: hypothetical protein NTZ78_10635 [Candidatus Aureabacteria bacterium]|nr:hypothetical protein [Candidatus Auribacterota bacterium]